MTKDYALELSSNRCDIPAATPTAALKEYQVPVRNPDPSFDDGNIAILSEQSYFLVHRGVLAHHSAPLREMIANSLMDAHNAPLVEGRIALVLPHPPIHLSYFLRLTSSQAFPVSLDGNDFQATSALLRLSTQYEVNALREEVLRRLSLSWPSNLVQWESRERRVTDANGVYAPRPTIPHPALIIDLAQAVNAPSLLPSALYDLSRYMPSQIVSDYIDIPTGQSYSVAPEMLSKILRGKEKSARYFSTFIVNALEGRTPSKHCVYRFNIQPSRKRSCQVAFETITMGILRDVNGIVLNHNSDPLFALHDSILMQTKADLAGTENNAVYRACESCRLEYGALVQEAREDFWRRLPEWFDLPVENWG
ncbi:hypothetical protein QCA50_004299 [Cerrena zonata]|uniref:BTB domain-containing protein n=1 Tax=Cerrena zonata TaxID=2478898 RepID=A0AAW0GIZ8_9APHY